MASLWAEIASGDFNIYGQWYVLTNSIIDMCRLALLAIILLVVAGFANIFSLSNASLILWAIISFVFAFMIILLEFPLCRRCCTLSEGFSAFIKKLENHIFRTVFYAVMATVMWLSVIPGSSATLIIVALNLTVVGACYLIAALKKEKHTETMLSGGNSV